MISALKNMIARCIERMRSGACADCDHRESCRFDWANEFGVPAGHAAPAAAAQRAMAVPRNPFAGFLDEVAKAFEARPKPRTTEFQRAVERQIEPLLATGSVRIEEVARALGYSRQTLYRRLKAEGTTFEQVLDDLRRRLALRLVRDEGLPVKEAAWRLGFSDPAAFSRAFKRWTGSSPRGPKNSSA